MNALVSVASVASVSAAAVPIYPSAAKAVPADSIFTAIDAHRRAWTELDHAVREKIAAQDRLPKELRGRVGMPVPINLPAEIDDIDVADPDSLRGLEIMICYTRDAIERAVATNVHHAERHPAICAQATRELRALQARQRRARSRAGLTAAERRVKLAHEGVAAAEDALLDVIPTTIAGVSAVLAYAAEHGSGGRSWPSGYAAEGSSSGWDRKHGVSWEVVLHKNLAKALPHIAAAA